LFQGEVEIPSLPEFYYEFKEAMEYSDGSFNESSEIISTDTGLTVLLLKIINSTFYAFPSQAARVITSHSKEINTERFFVTGM
jgi:HD-like signal output (HDOD) protein